MDKELSKLAAMKSVQEYKQRFLDNAQEEDHHLLKYESVLAESWKKLKAEDQVARQEMEREEAQHITQQKDDEWTKIFEQWPHWSRR